jgi:sulfonate dioxygenase
MAVIISPEPVPRSSARSKTQVQEKKGVVSYDINLPYAPQSLEEQERARQRTEYPDYLPNFEKVWYDTLPEFQYYDPALRADKQMPHLLHAAVGIRDITPKMGTILTGVKLETLSGAAKDELALLIAERKIVVLREQQEFLKSGPKFQQDFMAYFGKPNYQPVTGCVKGFPGFHIIHRDNNEAEIERFFEKKMTSTLWHQDVSYELQPPGYIMLGILACPDVGGDTVFADCTEAYK